MRVAASMLVVAVHGVVALAGCAPAMVDEPWRVTAPRVVAVVAEPAEVRPGARVVLEAVIAAPRSAIADAEVRWVRWVRCEAPVPFSQNEAGDGACHAALGDAVSQAPRTTLEIPADVCAVFGADVASAATRPRDPDATGGFYQPVAVGLGEARSTAFVRLGCRPGGLGAEAARAFEAQARPNRNPSFTLGGSVDGVSVAWLELPAGGAVDLFADWSAAPEESFPSVELSTGRLASQLERYDVTWLVTDGWLDGARSSSGRGRWRLPTLPGEGTLWAVLRDTRGGASVAEVAARWR